MCPHFQWTFAIWICYAWWCCCSSWMRIIRMERFVPYFLEKFKGKPTYPGDSTGPHNGCFFHTSIRRPHGQMLISSTLGIWILVDDPVDMSEIFEMCPEGHSPTPPWFCHSHHQHWRCGIDPQLLQNSRVFMCLLPGKNNMYILFPDYGAYSRYATSVRDRLKLDWDHILRPGSNGTCQHSTFFFVGLMGLKLREGGHGKRKGCFGEEALWNIYIHILSTLKYLSIIRVVFLYTQHL